LTSGTEWSARLQWQEVIFADRPRRLALSRLAPTWPCRSISLAVHRNMPFELIGDLLPPFLGYAGLRPDVVFLSDYDDSLSSLEAAPAADVHVVLLDFAKYDIGPSELSRWLRGRVAQLRRATDSPILVTDWLTRRPEAAAVNAALADALGEEPGVHLCATEAIVAHLGDALVDDRAADIASSDLSASAVTELARMFGSCWIPALQSPPIKCVVVDLDGTLYGGVLGEDGVDGVTISDEHRTLHEHLNELAAAGMFIALVSKNEPEDVEQLFARRADLALARERVSAWEISWDDKSDAVTRVRERLRIGPEAVLVVDDNPGELAHIAASGAAAEGLLASGPSQARRGLRWYPGVFRFGTTATDRTRTADIEASARRQAELERAVDPAEYLRSLDITLTYSRSNDGDVPRLHQLASRTNQFTTALTRPTEAALQRRLDDGSLTVIAVSLRDVLADSGVIGAVFCTGEDDGLVVEDVCISCRALGRDLESAIVLEALRPVVADAHAARVSFAYRRGPRNQPALDWLAAFTGSELGDERGTIVVPWSDAAVAAVIEQVPATRNWRDAGER
jgi:FkbH-like protein